VFLSITATPGLTIYYAINKIKERKKLSTPQFVGRLVSLAWPLPAAKTPGGLPIA